MKEALHPLMGRTAAAVARLLSSDERGAQLVEFAVSLPLLLVFVVGIFDFSGAFTLKQKLTLAARDAARAAAADPASDLGNPAPLSVSDAFQVVESYLQAEKINDCGLNGATASPTGTLTWTYTANTGCPTGGVTLTINRGYYFPQTGSSAPAGCTSQPPNGQTAVIATCVSLQYAYQWRFNRVISLLKGSAAGPSSITTGAVALNEN